MITRRQPPVKQNPQSFLHPRKIAENRRKTQKRCNFNLQIGCRLELPQSSRGCAQKMEDAANTVAGVEKATVSFMTQKMKVEFAEGADPHATMENVLSACKKVEDDCEIFDI